MEARDLFPRVRFTRWIVGAALLGAFVATWSQGTANAGLSAEVCGDATGDGGIEASDALFALRAAVGSRTCSLHRCDCDDNGTITASDAMAILKHAVGVEITLECPGPDTAASSTTSTTTTSLPGSCGDGVTGPDEDCEPPQSFCRGGCNPFTGICIDFICASDCSCPHPLCGDDLIDAGEDCDPPGSPCETGTCDDSCGCGP